MQCKETLRSTPPIKKYLPHVPPAGRDAAKDVVVGAVEIVQDALPYAKAVIGAVKFIYERYSAMKAVKVELRDFVNFIRTLETAVVAALKSFRNKDFLESLANRLKEAAEIVNRLATERKTKWRNSSMKM